MQRRGGRIGLRRADRLGREQHLPLQVGEVDPVVVDHAQRADAGRGQVEQDGLPSPPAPTASTRAAFRRSWPTPPSSGSTICRA